MMCFLSLPYIKLSSNEGYCVCVSGLGEAIVGCISEGGERESGAAACLPDSSEDCLLWQPAPSSLLLHAGATDTNRPD